MLFRCGSPGLGLDMWSPWLGSLVPQMLLYEQAHVADDQANELTPLFSNLFSDHAAPGHDSQETLDADTVAEEQQPARLSEEGTLTLIG